MATSYGTFSKLLMKDGEAPYTWSGADRFEFLREDIRKYRRFVGHRRGLRGTRRRHQDSVREGAYYVHGTVSLYVSPNDVHRLLTRIGFSGGVFQSTMPYFGMFIHRDHESWEIQDCKVNRWTLQGRAPEFREQGEPEMMVFTMEIFAKDCVTATWPDPEPSIPTGGTETENYVFQDGETNVVLNGVAQELEEFAISADNFLRPRFAFSRKPVDISARDSQYGFTATAPYNATTKALIAGGPDGIDGSVKLANGTVSTEFAFGRLIIPTHTPTVRSGKGEIKLRLEGEALDYSTSTNAMAITNDNTP